MICPNCKDKIEQKILRRESIGFWRYKFNCSFCNCTLTDNIIGEFVRVIGFLLFMFGVITFGDRWSGFVIEPVISVVVILVGVVIAILGQRMSLVAKVYKDSE